MKNYYSSFKFYLKRYLFENLGLPKVHYEQISKQVIIKYLPVNPVLIDCGANDGKDSIQLAKRIKGVVHCFEPVEELFIRLKYNTKDIPNIRCYQLALSNENSTQDFFVSEGKSDASSSLLEPKSHLTDHPDTFFKKKIQVNSLTLDRWAEINGVVKVDLLWLDMQGFELKMLEVSEKILETVSVIHTEVSTKETYAGVALYNTYKAFLEKKGFEVVLEAIPAGWDMGNVLFVRKELYGKSSH